MFLHGRKEDMSKSAVVLYVCAWSKGGNVKRCIVFVCFLGEVEKCSVFVCFWFLCGFAWWKGKCRKSVVLVESV